MALQDKASLIRLRLQSWQGVVTDPVQSKRVCAAANAQPGVAKVRTELLPGTRRLRAIATLAVTTRQWLARHTLPWGDGGERLVANRDLAAVIAGLEARRVTTAELVADLVNHYDDLARAARVRLGGLALTVQYPTAAEVRAAYVWRVSHTTIPADGSFAEFTQDDRIADAVKAAWARLRERVARYENPATVRTTTVASLRELCDLLEPMADALGSTDLEAVRQEIKAKLAKFDADVVRDVLPPDAVQAEAKRFLARIDQFMV